MVRSGEKKGEEPEVREGGSNRKEMLLILRQALDFSVVHLGVQ